LALLRGQVVRAKLVNVNEPKLFVVVSNNRRNSALGTVLAARMTSSSKAPIASVVPLGPDESFGGVVLCDDLIEIYDDEVIGVIAAISPQGMQAIGNGLKSALGLT
jgi:mRNA interferase MazF